MHAISQTAAEAPCSTFMHAIPCMQRSVALWLDLALHACWALIGRCENGGRLVQCHRGTHALNGPVRAQQLPRVKGAVAGRGGDGEAWA